MIKHFILAATVVALSGCMSSLFGTDTDFVDASTEHEAMSQAATAIDVEATRRSVASRSPSSIRKSSVLRLRGF